LCDLSELSKMCHIPASHFLRALTGYENETDFIILDGIAEALALFKKFKSKWNYEKQFYKFRRDLFLPAFIKYGYDSKQDVKQGVTDGMLRALLITVLGSSEHDETIQYAKKEFLKMTNSLTAVVADLRLPIAKVAAQTLDTLQPMEEIYKKSMTAVDESVVELSLHRVKESLLSEALRFLLDESMRPANTIMGVLAFRQCQTGRQMLWDLIQRKSTWVEKLPNNLSGALQKHTISSFIDEQQIAIAKEFYVKNPPKLQRSIQQGFDSARDDLRWSSKNSDDIIRFFNDY